MNTPKLFLGLLLAGSVAAGCDVDASDENVDYRVVAHVDVGSIVATPWVASALDLKSAKLDAEAGPCAPMIRAAESVTVGGSKDKYEVYVTGKFDSDDADACAAFIEKKAGEHHGHHGPGKSKPKPKAELVDADVLAIYGGAIVPSRARMQALRGSDPSPKASPMWVVVADDGSANAPVKAVRAWASTAKGLDAHVEVKLESEAKATELYGKAALGLAAMQLSGEAAELARTVSLGSKGDTLTGDVHASPALLKKLVDAKHARIDADLRDDDDGDHHGKLEIRVGN